MARSPSLIAVNRPRGQISSLDNPARSAARQQKEQDRRQKALELVHQLDNPALVEAERTKVYAELQQQCAPIPPAYTHTELADRLAVVIADAARLETPDVADKVILICCDGFHGVADVMPALEAAGAAQLDCQVFAILPEAQNPREYPVFELPGC
jgi:hypothetical protein